MAYCRLFSKERIIFLFETKACVMKKIVAFVLLASFISACSQYTCPTYTKKEAPKHQKSTQRI